MENIYLDSELAKTYPNAVHAILLMDATVGNDEVWWKAIRSCVKTRGLNTTIKLLSETAALPILSEHTNFHRRFPPLSYE